jgi:hypothetical protein
VGWTSVGVINLRREREDSMEGRIAGVPDEIGRPEGKHGQDLEPSGLDRRSA